MHFQEKGEFSGTFFSMQSQGSTWAACAQCPHLLLRVNNYFDFDSYLCLYLLHVFDKLVKKCNHKVSTWPEYSQISSICTSECTSDITNEKLCICFCAWIRICLCTFAVFLARVLASHVVFIHEAAQCPSICYQAPLPGHRHRNIRLWGKQTSYDKLVETSF